MKIAILTEGIGEYKSLPNLYSQIKEKLPNRTQIIKPMRVHTTPDGPPGQIVAACRAPLKIARGLGARRAVLILDRERQTTHPGQIAKEIEAALRENSEIEVYVAIKDRMFENWLIADLNALRAQPARFKVAPALVKRVEPNKADSVDALGELKRAIVAGNQYDKIKDGDRISNLAKVEDMARHSRSFRHFLHLLGYEPYRDQCAKPCKRTM